MSANKKNANRLSRSVFTVIVLIQSLTVAAQTEDPAQIPGDQFEPKQIPGDQFEPKQIPGDQFEPKQIPGDQFEPKQIPGDQFDASGDTDSRLLLHLPMDGSFENSGSIEGKTELVIGDGGSQPQFVEGAFGRAFHFDGKTVLAIPVDLTLDDYRTVTMTGWVKMNDDSTSGMTIMSTGTGVRLQVHGRTSSASPGGPLFYTKEKIQPGEWSFVAVVYDLDNNRVRLQKDGEYYEHKIKEGYQLKGDRTFRNPNDPDREPGRYLFVGGSGFSKGWPATNIAVDDVRLYAGALTEAELTALAGARQAAQANCSVGDVAGTYQTRANVMACQAAAGNQISCSYGPNNGNNLSLQVNANVTAASGTWSQPSGLGGPAAFDIDESCELTNGRWGMAGGTATKPWDSDGVIARVGDPTGGTGDDVPPSEWSGRGNLTDEQLADLQGGVINEEERAEATRRAPVDAEQREQDEYQEELYRQQNEEERQRREQEAADSGTTVADVGPAVEPVRNGPPVPVGPRLKEALSGYSGDSQFVLDLETEFLTEIAWKERSDVPCAMYIWGHLGEATDVMASKCGGGINLIPASFRSGPTYLNIKEPHVVEGLAVCSTFNKNKRLKGIRVVGGELRDDGTTSWETSEDRRKQMKNCSEWHPIQRCRISTNGPSYAATGVEVQYNHHQSWGVSYYEIVGISLICREIGFATD